jgi:two-component system, sensor histidine kinase and response regulator
VRLHFTVCDSGAGIAPDRLDAIFESFTQEDASTTRRYGGTGLGLTITRQLVELMGGSIGVQSARGRGSCFEFDLVVGCAEAEHAPVQAHPLRALRIVLAEADPACAEAMSRKLGAYAGSMLHVASGDALIARAMELQERDVVLLDPKLPGARRALAALAATPARVVLLVATSDPTEPDLRTHPAVHATLLRPVCADALTALVTRAATDAPPEPSATSATSGPQRRSLRVLVAEDNVVNQKLAMAMLERLGHRAVLAADGQQAVTAYEQENFDVVLMDMQMPELDGLQATRAIREIETLRGGHVPIIALTANAMVGDRERCLEAGMDDYLSKPIRRAALDLALQRADRLHADPVHSH